MKNKFLIVLVFTTLTNAVNKKVLFKLRNQIYMAFWNRNKKDAEKYIKKLAKIAPPDWIAFHLRTAGDDTNGALHEAVDLGSKTAVETLLRSGMDVNDNAIRYGVTPLHIAAQTDNTEIAKILIENGASIDAAANNGNTPLINACIDCNKEMFQLLTFSCHAKMPANLLEIVEAEHFNRSNCIDKEETEKFREWLKKQIKILTLIEQIKDSCKILDALCGSK